MKLNVRMLAIDMDGTLLNNQKRISEENAAALKKLQAEAIHLVICTGRHPQNARLLLQRHGLSCPVIGLNGSLIVNDKGTEFLAEHPFSPEDAEKVIELLEKNQMDYMAFTKTYMALREQTEGAYTRLRLNYIYEISNGNYKAGPAEIKEALKQRVYKFAAFNKERPGLLRKTRAELGEYEHLNIAKSADSNIEIMPGGIDKGSGILDYARLLNIPAEEIMAIGDQENDIPMLKSAGYSIAMGNASEQVKLAAGYQTESNEENGVAKALGKYVLAN
jgi:Cof subfamily protein (haloacid dehalogenase superfamily)